MVEEHTRTDVAHHVANAFAAVGGVAVDLAFAAASLPVPFRTAVKPLPGVSQQFSALRT